MTPLRHDRRRRPGPPRGTGPGRRPESGPEAAGPAADHTWELWNLRALFPEAGLEDLLAIKASQDRLLAREREALAGLWSGNRVILGPGHGFFAEHPELGTGMTVSLHLGPYQLLAEPYAAAGRAPLIVLNAGALSSFKQHAESLLRKLGHGEGLGWASLGDPGFVRRIIAAVRDDRPVLVYLDGNDGQGGMATTRDQGLDYALPGRTIRVRTGLARLACRLGCPVHTVAVHWGDEGLPVWEAGPSRRCGPGDDPAAVTRGLFAWCFTQVMRRPDQWHHWSMLRHSSACFRQGPLEEDGVPAGLREDFGRAFQTCLTRSPETVRLVLENQVEVWREAVLADLSADRFYPAAGLRDQDLEILRTGRPTLAELSEYHGRAWVGFHGLRLCLLGMARLGS
ncbi:MAG: hypothetical protein ABIK96_09355 [bacterium]